MIHGPGCPVCVTPLELIDKALAIASQPGVIFCSFGDMLRVPGTDSDLFQVKGRGGDVRVVYSPLDAVDLAVKNPDKQVVFFGVGFETTAPANAMSVHLAKRRGLTNFSLLVSHVLVPPGQSAAIMSSPGNHHPTRRPHTCRPFSRPVTFAASWAIGSTHRSPRSSACPSSSPALNL